MRRLNRDFANAPEEFQIEVKGLGGDAKAKLAVLEK